MTIPLSSDALRGMANDGMCEHEIAADTGFSRWAIRRAAERFGICLPDGKSKDSGFSELRFRVESMPPREAVEILLYLVGELLGAGIDDVLEGLTLPALTPKEEQMLRFFLAHEGLLVTHDKILDALYLDQDAPAGRIVQVYICKLRKKLPSHLVIESVWGRGYVLRRVPADG